MPTTLEFLYKKFAELDHDLFAHKIELLSNLKNLDILFNRYLLYQNLLIDHLTNTNIIDFINRNIAIIGIRKNHNIKLLLDDIDKKLGSNHLTENIDNINNIDTFQTICDNNGLNHDTIIYVFTNFYKPGIKETDPDYTNHLIEYISVYNLNNTNRDYLKNLEIINAFNTKMYIDADSEYSVKSFIDFYFDIDPLKNHQNDLKQQLLSFAVRHNECDELNDNYLFSADFYKSFILNQLARLVG